MKEQRFNFCSTTVPGEFFGGFKYLNEISLELFINLVAQVYTKLISGRDDSVTKKTYCSEDESNSLALQYGVDKSKLRTATHALQTVIQGAASRRIPTAFLDQDLLQLGLADERRQLLTKQVTEDALAQIAENSLDSSIIKRLIDMKWTFGVTASSSELSQVGSTYLQLKLKLASKDDSTEEMLLELTLPQFYTFLHELEKARANLEFA